MTVYVDDMLRPAVLGPINSRWSHLLSDTDDELHAFALRLGLSRAWAQYPGTWRSHYDVSEDTRETAIQFGAVPITYLVETGGLIRARRAGQSFDLAEFRESRRRRRQCGNSPGGGARVARG